MLRDIAWIIPADSCCGVVGCFCLQCMLAVVPSPSVTVLSVVEGGIAGTSVVPLAAFHRIAGFPLAWFLLTSSIHSAMPTYL